MLKTLPHLAFLAVLASPSLAGSVYNSFDGEGFPTCYNVSTVYNATSVDEMASLVRDAAAKGHQVRAAGKGHMWYDTQCSDDETVLISTEEVAGIYNFSLQDGAETGTVVIEAGVTFFQLAEYLHERGANIGTGLVNWNISLGGSVAMGAHRSGLREQAVVVGGVISMDIIDGTGAIRTVAKDESSEEWLAASTSLGLLGIIARMTMVIHAETILYADQKTLEEADVLDGDIKALIDPYLTANLWWWPYHRKFHQRFYDVVENGTANQNGFQSTFSTLPADAALAETVLNAGKTNSSYNILAENTFFQTWEKPNFHNKETDVAITEWPVTGYNYDVLIGGLYPNQLPAWDYGLAMYTMELAFPLTQANAMLKRARALFDAQLDVGIVMTATYKSGINIKFAKANFDFLGQATYNTSDGADWSQGAIMLDFPSWYPTIGDHLRFNEPFYKNLTDTLIAEFPCRPHWTKNTRTILEQTVTHIDPDHLARFKAVREAFDPNGLYRSVVGEILGLYS